MKKINKITKKGGNFVKYVIQYNCKNEDIQLIYNTLMKGEKQLKKIIASAAALLCSVAFVSCDIAGTITTTPTPTGNTAPITLPSTNVQTISPITAPPTTDVVTDIQTPTPTPTPSLTPTPTEQVNKFDNYVTSDFDMTIDDTDPIVNYVECGKGVMIKGDLVVVNAKYGYNSKYTSSLASGNAISYAVLRASIA